MSSGSARCWSSTGAPGSSPTRCSSITSTRTAVPQTFERRVLAIGPRARAELRQGVWPDPPATRARCPARVRRDYAPVFLLRLFQHRQVEFLLRPFDERLCRCGPVDRASRGVSIRALAADADGPSGNPPLPRQCDGRNDDRAGVPAPPAARPDERRPLLALRRVLGESVDSPRLRNAERSNRSARRVPASGAGDHFVVDLDSAEGLVRAPTQGAVRCLFLDPSPLLDLIDARHRRSRSGGTEGAGHSMFGSGGRAQDCCASCARSFHPRPPRVNRRGERKPVAVIVQAVVGFNNIVRMLRNEETPKSRWSIRPSCRKSRRSRSPSTAAILESHDGDGSRRRADQVAASGRGVRRAAPDVGDPGPQRIRLSTARQGRRA